MRLEQLGGWLVHRHRLRAFDFFLKLVERLITYYGVGIFSAFDLFEQFHLLAFVNELNSVIIVKDG